jgi:2'-5' RNA ligase
MTARLFVAVTPPPEVAEHLANFLEPRQQVDSPLRWSTPDRWHLTLAFLPRAADRDFDGLVEALQQAAAKRPAIELGLAEGGSFPSADRAKVLFVGVRGKLDMLTRLSTGVRNAANTAGVEVDGTAFRPHVTLARVSRPTDATRWLRVLDTYSGPSWLAAELELIQSEVGAGPRGAARYHTLDTFPLG